MSPNLVATIIGLILMVFTMGQVAPSISAAISGKNVELNLSREEALMQQIVRYRTLEGAFPTSMTDLTNKSYWRTVDNDNGFGGTYTFAVDETRGIVTITTTISDSAKRAQYIANYRHVFRPSDIGNGVLATKFVMPSTGTMGVAIPATGQIAVGTTAPDPASNTFWYDTSSGTAVLKVSNGTTWTAATSTTTGGGGMAAPSSSNIVTGVSSLPTTANPGDVRYVLDSSSNALNTYVYYGGQWVEAASGNGSTAITPTATNQGDCSGYNDNTLGRDTGGTIYVCQSIDSQATCN